MIAFIIMVYFSRRNKQVDLLGWEEMLAKLNIFIIQSLGVAGVQIYALGTESFICGFVFLLCFCEWKVNSDIDNNYLKWPAPVQCKCVLSVITCGNHQG